MKRKKNEVARILIATGAAIAVLVVVSIVGVAVMLNFDAIGDFAVGSGFSSANRAYGKIHVGMDRSECLAALEDIPGLFPDSSRKVIGKTGMLLSLEETYGFTIGEDRDCTITLKFVRENNKLALKSKYNSGF